MIIEEINVKDLKPHPINLKLYNFDNDDRTDLRKSMVKTYKENGGRVIWQYIEFDYNKDEIVNLLEEIVTDLFDLNDILNTIIRPIVVQAMNSRMPSSVQGTMSESQRIVKSWKSFLKG